MSSRATPSRLAAPRPPLAAGRHRDRRDRRDPGHHRHHPWRRFAGFADWRLEWTDALEDGVWGRTDHARRTVVLARGLDQAERRCTIAHETQHIIRGPLPPGADDHDRLREELTVDRTVARLLIPSVRRVGEALVWAGGDHDVAADELWVDRHLLAVRMTSLSAAEAAWLHRRLGGLLP